MSNVPTSVMTDNTSSPFARFHRYRQKNRDGFEAWVILTPIMLYYALFAIIPVLINVVASFSQWNGITAPEWVGVDNYVRYFTDPFYLEIFTNTALFTFGSLLISVPLGLVVAVLLNQKIRAMGLYRSLWYLPAVTSAAIMAQLVSIFIAPYGGVLNSIISSLGFDPVIWTINIWAMRIMIILFSVWRGIGTTMILYLAALQAIPEEMYQAAEVDGAGSVAKFIYITIPMVRNMTLFVVVTGIIAGFQIFEPILLISKGGPLNKTNTIINQIYNDAFINADFGLATTAGTVLGIILLFASIFAQRISRQGEA